MITVSVKDQDVLAILQKLSSRMTDMRPAMANVAMALASESERQFATQTGPLGRWPDLTEASKAMRAARGTWPGQMLQVSAAGLAASVQTDFGPNFAQIGSNKPYAAMHMFGGVTSATSMIPGKKIPARPYLPFNPETHELSDSANLTVLEVLSGFLEV